MRHVKWLLLGLSRRRAGDNEGALAGRAQTRWGAWWDRHPLMLRVLAVIAVAWMVTYIVWRVIWSWRGADPWLGGPLLLAEGFGLWNLVMLTWLSWRMPPLSNPPASPGRVVDVYICTYDEPLSVVRSTLVGCAAMTYPHTTYVLDDGRRPEMAALAVEWGAEYIARGGNAHAKAGNINNALRLTAGELVLMLDADHVPLPNALDALVGYFDEEKVALVQTPHDFYNHHSVQHYEVGRHEQSVFYSVILPGKDRHGAVFWCGSGALIRRDALLGIGGVATETIAEDFHTTIKLQRSGWSTRYHDEVLIQGLGPHDLDGYLLQRDRWARGNLAVFTTAESPLRARELSRAQRLSYFASLSSYFAGPMRLLSLLVLTAVVWTGQLPLHATLLTLATLWAPATLLSIGAGSALCRGYQSVADTTHFELCTAEVYTRALRCIVRPGKTAFKVTPKEGIDLGGWASIRRLRVVNAVAILLGVGLLARLVGDAGLSSLPHLRGIAVWVVPLFAAVELRRILRTIILVGEHRQLRREYRVPLHADVLLELPGIGEQPVDGQVCDISPSGVRIRVPGLVVAWRAALATFEMPTPDGGSARVQLHVQVGSARAAGDGCILGGRITGLAPSDQRRLLEYCYVVSAQQRLRHAATTVSGIRLAPVAAAPSGWFGGAASQPAALGALAN
jgi:cellulose synthase (UDP-forming)